MCWFGYGSAQYKELVQSTVTHNMVMVDQLQQEAVPSTQPVFYSGDMMQLSLTQTQARWRPIPRNNIDKFPPWDDFDFVTEPILQRKLSIVTDDYLVMVDFVKSDKEREYDCLVHPLGFKSVEGAQKVGEVLDVVSTDEMSPYKYFTNCQWYKGSDKGANFKFNDSGYGLDLHLVYPQSADILFAEYPTTGKWKEGEFKNNPERRTVAMRVNGREATFITLLEPYRKESVIESVEALSGSEIVVTLKCGTTQKFTISGLEGGNGADVKVTMESTTPKGKVKKEQN